MNLIDRLGGYGAAKSLKMSQIGLKKHYDELKSALLEYRRQNNIFEIGDLVVFKEEYSKDSVIHKIDSLRAGTKCLRHATDEEIEKGCRL
ncbi:hypothetical protein C7457_1693 [Thermovibrio guaymasensis]|uniref:Uncharacterized protein n=1 Tax=Thermovibrio guaymasensis TaxID=240167 RepID=A0A420W5G1_9BACT|nr:hypothetical protein [Thermovibrio guaymasensis]RKQ59905.1 hypothetical protein C7457_1693 [Thermovibrio guaymasensis]